MICGPSLLPLSISRPIKCKSECCRVLSSLPLGRQFIPAAYELWKLFFRVWAVPQRVRCGPRVSAINASLYGPQSLANWKWKVKLSRVEWSSRLSLIGVALWGMKAGQHSEWESRVKVRQLPTFKVSGINHRDHFRFMFPFIVFTETQIN